MITLPKWLLRHSYQPSMTPTHVILFEQNVIQRRKIKNSLISLHYTYLSNHPHYKTFYTVILISILKYSYSVYSSSSLSSSSSEWAWGANLTLGDTCLQGNVPVRAQPVANFVLLPLPWAFILNFTIIQRVPLAGVVNTESVTKLNDQYNLWVIAYTYSSTHFSFFILNKITSILQHTFFMFLVVSI